MGRKEGGGAGRCSVPESERGQNPETPCLPPLAGTGSLSPLPAPYRTVRIVSRERAPARPLPEQSGTGNLAGPYYILGAGDGQKAVFIENARMLALRLLEGRNCLIFAGGFDKMSGVWGR